MTNDQEPESFGLALREAAYDFEPPNPERFHTYAVTRTRRTLAALGRRGYAPGLVARLIREGLAREGVADDGVTSDDAWDGPPEE